MKKFRAYVHTKSFVQIDEFFYESTYEYYVSQALISHYKMIKNSVPKRVLKILNSCQKN